MKRQPMVVSKISLLRWKASVALPITNGARDIDSTPPAMAKSISPARIACAAAPTALRPDAHRRFTVMPGTLWGSPASRSAMRATLRLSSPAWLAQPRITSSMRSPGTRVRFSSAASGMAARSSGRTSFKAPLWRPTGVRAASQMRASFITFSGDRALAVARSARVHEDPVAPHPLEDHGVDEVASARDLVEEAVVALVALLRAGHEALVGVRRLVGGRGSRPARADAAAE